MCAVEYDVVCRRAVHVEVCCVQLVRGVEVIVGGGDEEMRQSTRERFIPLLLDRYKVQLSVYYTST